MAQQAQQMSFNSVSRLLTAELIYLVPSSECVWLIIQPTAGKGLDFMKNKIDEIVIILQFYFDCGIKLYGAINRMCQID